MMSEDVGWIVGADGTIIYTNNGGTTWVQQTSGTTENIYDVSFVDLLSGWAVGYNGVILHTTDSGTTWSFQSTGITDDFTRVSVIDANEVWAVAADGFHTTDGGLTWTTVPIPCSLGLWGVDFANSDLGIAMGNGGIVTRYTSVTLNPPQNLFVTDEGYATWQAPGEIGSILVVDHDGSYDEYSDCWPAYQAALDANGYTYTYYEVLDISLDGPDLATIQQHDCIIWFSGEAWGYYGDDCMTPTDEANLATYLDGGGSLFFAGQDYLWASYPSAGTLSSGQFPYDYLGISNVSQDAWIISAPSVGTAEGSSGSIAEGFSFTIEDIFTTNREGLFVDQIISNNGLDLFNITSPAPAGVAAVQYDGSTFRTIFSTMAFAAITDPTIRADLMAIIVGYLSSGDENRDLLGYNVYLEGTFVDYTTDLFYQYTGLVNGTTYLAEVTALYDEGESSPIEYSFTFIEETFDPPTNVAVDDVTGTVSWDPPGGGVYLFFDDFDSYTAGDYLCTQTTDWVPWSGTPGGADDAYVSNEQANSAPNSVKIEGAASDIIHMFGNLTTGHYIVSFQYYVATGCGGYFNLMHDFTGESRDDLRNEWAIESYFSTDGSGYINAGGSSSATFTYPNGAWFECMIDIDLDSDLAEYYVNGVFVHGWQWSLQATGSAGMCQLGVVDFFAAAPTGETVTYYFDDFALSDVSAYRELTGYNIYIDGALMASNIMPTPLEYTYSDLIPLQAYIAGVSAVYDDPGESIIVEAPFTYNPVFNPPQNLDVECFDDYAHFIWEAPAANLNPCDRKTKVNAEETRELTGYNVYLDQVEVVTNIPDLEYDFYGLVNGDFYYAGVKAIYDDPGESELVEIYFQASITGAGNIIPLITELTGNYPNPFNPETNIAFSVKEAGKVTLEIYNIKGEKVRTLIKGHREAAYYNVIWNGKDNSGKQIASGVYFYKMKTGKYVSTKKMILMK